MSLDEFIKQIKRSHQHIYLYHFTDSRNLQSISDNGLLSKSELAIKGIEPIARGGNEISRQADNFQGLNGYVNLSFTRGHPMKYIAVREGRLQDVKILAISPDILKLQDVKLTLDVANKTGVPLLDFADNFNNIDFEVIYTRTKWADPIIQTRLQAAEKCEILIPREVERQYIKSVF